MQEKLQGSRQLGKFARKKRSNELGKNVSMKISKELGNCVCKNVANKYSRMCSSKEKKEK